MVKSQQSTHLEADLMRIQFAGLLACVTNTSIRSTRLVLAHVHVLNGGHSRRGFAPLRGSLGTEYSCPRLQLGG